MRIAIIDEGVDFDHPRLENCRITGKSVYDPTLALVHEDTDDFRDATGHGTAIASIIHKIAPKAQLYAIKLVKENNRIKEELLIEGIKECLALDDLKIVNISMGIATDAPLPLLYTYCEQLYKKGVFIVVASHNFPNIECYPARFPFVYSVGCGLVKNQLQYSFRQDSIPKILAKGGLQRVAWRNKSYKISSGTSYATAHFSGILAKMIEEKNLKTPDEIYTQIVENNNADVEEYLFTPRNYSLIESRKYQLSKKDEQTLGEEIFTSHKIDFLKDFAVFPYSEKEIKTILELHNSSSSNLTLAVDYPKSILSKPNLRNESVPLKFINREPSQDELASFDTLIVGYFMDIPVESNIMFGVKLLKVCVSQNKNFIVFDNDVYLHLSKIIRDEYPAYTGKIHFTSLQKETVSRIKNFKHLEKVSVPVIAYVGTGSKQGKFTGQVKIKQILNKHNYKASLLSSEPQGVVLGADFVFPFGHNSNVELKFREWTSCLETIMKGIQYFNHPDIIITGIQGGILPRSFHFSASITGSILNPLQFLLGVRPDAIICAIHPNDSISLINQTIKTVENYCGSICLFCTINPVYTEIESVNNTSITKTSILSKSEMERLKKQYSEQLDIPVVDIMNPDDEQLILNRITNFFS